MVNKLHKTVRVGLTLTSFLLGGLAFANKHTVNFDYDVSFNYMDNGFEKTDEVTPPKTVDVSQTGYLSFSGELNPQLSYNVYLNVFGDSVQAATEVAMATLSMSKALSLSVGRSYTNQGGFDNKNWNFATATVSPYTAKNLVIPGNAPMIMPTLHLGKGGDISIQITNDVSGKGYISQAHSQPATLLEWSAKFGPVNPMIQIVPYDNGNSLQTAVSLGVNTNKFTAYFDYVMDTRKSKSTTEADKREDTVYTNIVADMAFDLGAVAPFLKFATFDTVQPGTDLKGNSAVGEYNDNGQTMAVGLNLPVVNKMMVPYLAYVSDTSKVVSAENAEEVETKTQTKVVIGFGGTI